MIEVFCSLVWEMSMRFPFVCVRVCVSRSRSRVGDAPAVNGVLVEVSHQYDIPGLQSNYYKPHPPLPLLPHRRPRPLPISYADHPAVCLLTANHPNSSSPSATFYQISFKHKSKHREEK